METESLSLMEDALSFQAATRSCLSAGGETDLIAPNKVGPYLLKHPIGRGSFSLVKLAVNTETNEQVACKIIPKKRLLHCGLDDRFEREIRILQKLKHTCICQLLDILKDTLNYYVILELCPGGTLLTKIVKEKRLSEDVSKVIFKQIVDALKYIHDFGIVHRDLKPENVLINDGIHVKVIDFGLSNFQDKICTTNCGSASYASPECISQPQYDGKKSDMWSLGVILYTMLNGHLPWTKRNEKQLVRQILTGEYFVPANVSDAAQSLIRGLISVDVEKRWTIDQVLACEWLHNVRGATPKLDIPGLELAVVEQFFSEATVDDQIRGEVRHILWITKRRAITCRKVLVPRLTQMKTVC